MEVYKEVLKPIPKRVSEEMLKSDLERYKNTAIELGADAAEIIPTSYVHVDERVRLKCFVPRCPRYGETPNCPPGLPSPEEVRKALSRYSHAIFFKTEIRPVADYIPIHGSTRTGSRQTLYFHKKTSEIVNDIERMAFKDGYYLALGLGGGSCKDYICAGQICQFIDSGRCRAPLKARPSMEAFSIEVVGLINKVGWEIYPLTYAEDNPEAIPFGISVGIVFIC